MSLILETERLILRTSTKRMLKDIMDFHYRNREFFKPWEAQKSSDYYSRDYHLRLLAAEKAQIRSFSGIDFWIYHKADQLLIGKISIFGIMGGNFSNCMAGYKLDQNYNGSGYMHEALKETIRFIFEEINLHRMEINIMPRNTRSVHVVEQLGFELECESKQFVEVNGVWENHLRYSKLNDRFKNN